MQTRFNGNVVPFADDATSTNRTVFGGTTQSDNIDDNLNADFKKGWEIVGLNDNPTREDFNAMGYTLGALTAYLYEMGIAEWNASQNYRIGSRVVGSDGKIYKALTGTIGTPNVNHNPINDTVNWEWELKSITDYSGLTAKTTPVDADLIPLSDSASSFGLKKLSWLNIKNTIISSFGGLINGLTAKVTPIDEDMIIVADSASSNASKKLTFANLKAMIFTNSALTGTPTAPTPTAGDNSTKLATTAYVKWELKTITDYSALTAKATPVDADLLALGDSASSFSLKKLSWANLKTALLTYFDTLYTRTANLKEIGVGQTWQDVTASRSAGVTYTNTTGKPIKVRINSGAAGTDAVVSLYINGQLNCKMSIRAAYDQDATISEIIPSGSTYSFEVEGGLRSVWELR